MKKVIVLQDWGCWLRKSGERFVVGIGKDKSKKREYPAGNVDMIVVSNPSTSLTVSALKLAVDNKIPVFFTYSSGYPYAVLFPIVSTGSARTRMEQYLAREDKRGLELAKGFATGKLLNQYYLLMSFSRYRRKRVPEKAKELEERALKIREIVDEVKKVSGDKLTFGIRTKLMSLESRGAEVYWDAISRIIPETFNFVRREKRGATDPINSLLNYGYGCLLARVTTAIFYVGLDPYAGYLHVDRAGRESLALDLMEEFRQQTVDRVVLRLILTRTVKEDAVDSEGKLTKKAISSLLEAFEERLSTFVYLGSRRLKVGTAIKQQARLIVRHILGNEKYSPFYLRY